MIPAARARTPAHGSGDWSIRPLPAARLPRSRWPSRRPHARSGDNRLPFQPISAGDFGSAVSSCRNLVPGLAKGRTRHVEAHRLHHHPGSELARAVEGAGARLGDRLRSRRRAARRGPPCPRHRARGSAPSPCWPGPAHRPAGHQHHRQMAEAQRAYHQPGTILSREIAEQHRALESAMGEEPPQSTARSLSRLNSGSSMP